MRRSTPKLNLTLDFGYSLLNTLFNALKMFFLYKFYSHILGVMDILCYN